MITMLLGGLWHGASWNFVVWGCLHGVYLALHRLINRGRRVTSEAPPRGLREWVAYLPRALATFHLVALSWIMFRASDIQSAADYVLGLVSGRYGAVDPSDSASFNGMVQALVFYGLLTILLDLPCWRHERELPFTARARWWVRGLAYGVALIVLAFVREPTGEAFIYFQF
jgi:D-alanyl-lipoteichoic acid acyltransferase DltB (MBOAT superfamily)